MSKDDGDPVGATLEISFTPRRRRTSPGATVPSEPVPIAPGSRRRRTSPAARVPKPPADESGTPTGDQWQEDRTRRREVARLARLFLVHLDTLARLLVTHDPNNSAVRAALQQLEENLGALRELEGDVAIVFAEGHAFVNGVWVRATKRAFEAASVLTDGLSDLDGRGIVFQKDGGLGGVVGLARLLRLARRDSTDDERREAARALPGLQLIPVSGADQARGSSVQARDKALTILKEGMETLSRMELANLDLYLRRRQRALVRTLVQMAEESPEELLAITAIRDPTLPPSAHSLLVAIYSICMGRSMDLGRRDMMRLGVAALNHNLGEAAVGERVFAERRELNSHERSLVEQHPLLGLDHLLSHYGLGAPSVERALVSAEHHVHWEGTAGYPLEPGRPTHLFSRTVAVADVFDALCSERPWRKAYAPDQGVKLLLRQAGRQLDPALTRLLVRMVGRYPPGSLVELSSGEWAIVLGPGAGATPLERPRVLLIADEDGFEHPKPMVVDLGERYPRRRAWLRTITRPRDARKIGLRVVRYLLADRIVVEPVRLDHDVKRAPVTPR
jgi:HD-GYP domain-containing protein (c-di-GMP phosphodiesterase class II)